MYWHKQLFKAILVTLVIIFVYAIVRRVVYVFESPEQLIANNFYFPQDCPKVLIGFLRCFISVQIMPEAFVVLIIWFYFNYQTKVPIEESLKMSIFVAAMYVLFCISAYYQQDLRPYIWLGTLGRGFSLLENFIYNLIILSIAIAGLVLWRKINKPRAWYRN